MGVGVHDVAWPIGEKVYVKKVLHTRSLYKGVYYMYVSTRVRIFVVIA